MIRPLEQQTVGHRIATTFIIVVVVILLIALIGWLSGGWEAQGQYRVQSVMPGLPTTKWDSRMFALDREAADAAYTEHVKKLILVALSHPEDTASFQRGTIGARNTRKAYIAIMEAIEKREREAEQAK